METNQTYQNELGSAMLPFVMRELVDTVMKRKNRTEESTKGQSKDIAFSNVLC